MSEEKLIATLTRALGDGKETCGVFSCENFFCRTLERPWMNNQHGVSCIPAGTYPVEWSHMDKANRDHYQVMNVPDRDAIFIHAGNFVTDVHGCILLGSDYRHINSDDEQDIIESGKTLDAFESFMNKEPFTLIVVDPSPAMT